MKARQKVTSPEPSPLPVPEDPAAVVYPAEPGVYLMHDAEGTIIYVGKAVNLRSRVRSYFSQESDGRPFFEFLRRRIARVETIVTQNEKEALLLENTLIKEHRPRYNIRLRDDKQYLSLRLDLSHDWPRLHPIRKKIAGDNKSMYFGPFSSSAALRETLRFLLTVFPLRSCSDHTLTHRNRPCILHQIKRCTAPCVGRVAAPDYAAMVEAARLFFEGRREDVVQLLRERMILASEEMRFEEAAQLRDRIMAIEKTIEKEQVVSHRVFDRDVVGMVRERGRVAFALLPFRAGKLREAVLHDTRDLDLDDSELLEQFVSRYYTLADVPRDVLLPSAVGDPGGLEAVLRALRGGAVRVLSPQRGSKRRLVELAERNARIHLERQLSGEKSAQDIMRSLQERLDLPREPLHIECFDISNIQGSLAVGSMVCFRNGEPDKANYRHFVIRTVEGSNDFAMMKETLERRYRRQIDEGKALPDLVLIDGGRGQLSSAQEIFAMLGMESRVPLAAIAKSRLVPAAKRPYSRRPVPPVPQGPPPGSVSPGEGSADQLLELDPNDPALPGVGAIPRTEERIFLPNRKNPVTFRRSDPALFLLQRIRDEAHRFGITFHRKLRSRSSLRSALDSLPGIGKTRRTQLLRHFGSVTKLREATLEQIRAVPRLPVAVADTIFKFLHPDQPELFPDIESAGAAAPPESPEAAAAIPGEQDLFGEPDSPEELSDADLRELEAESGAEEEPLASGEAGLEDAAATTDQAVDSGKLAWDDTSWVHLIADDDPPPAAPAKA